VETVKLRVFFGVGEAEDHIDAKQPSNNHPEVHQGATKDEKAEK